MKLFFVKTIVLIYVPIAFCFTWLILYIRAGDLAFKKNFALTFNNIFCYLSPNDMIIIIIIRIIRKP